MFKKSKGQKLTLDQLQHCLRRNFGGKSNVSEIVDMFLEDIPAKYLRTEKNDIVSNLYIRIIIELYYLYVRMCMHTGLWFYSTWFD